MSKKALDSNLDFDGMAGDGVSRSGDRFSGNHFSEHMKENFGNGPRSASQNSQASMHKGPGATKDSYKTAPDRASAKGGKINGGAEAKCPSNPDKINVGMK